MGQVTAFSPVYKKGQSLTTGAASAAVAIGEGSQSLCITNTGAVNGAYISVGPSTVTAEASDYYIKPGEKVIISKAAEHTHLAHLQATASTTLHVIPGEGK